MEIVVNSVSLPLVDGSDHLPSLVDAAVDEPDIVCVASTVVSKSEGRAVSLDSYEASERALELASRVDHDPRFVEAVLDESVELLIDEPFLLAVTPFGHVAPNAGIDRSNVEDGVLLLPEEPDESARRISDAVGCPVVVTDTCGRPFRRGQTGVAVGWHGIGAVRDWRGETDLNGRELEATEEAVVDELAAVANLAMGEGDGGTPVVAFEGVEADDGDDELFRPKEDDVVRQALLEVLD